MIAVLQKRFDHFWIGVYYLRDSRLVLGPFQGPPACVYLSLDKGVCAACATRNESLLVADVHAFQGHIACDPRSKSEIVIPFHDEHGAVRAVFDVDSDQADYFDDTDREYLERISRLFEKNWP